MIGNRILGLALVVLIAGCGGDDGDSRVDAGERDGGSPDGGAGDGGAGDAGTPSSVRIVAGEGGTVASPDGVFTLIVPPDALAEDTDVAITIVPRAEWPAEVAANEPLGEVYDVQPDGLEFLAPAIGVHRYVAVPDALRTAEGEYVVASHLSRAADGTLEAAPKTATWFLEDGVAVVAELEHLSAQWATAMVRGTTLTVRFDVDDASDHHVGDVWRATRFEARSSSEGTWYGVSSASQVFYSSPRYLAPVFETPGADTLVTADGTFSTLTNIFFGRPFGAEARAGTYHGDVTLSPDTAFVLSDPLPGWWCESVGDTGNVPFVSAGFTMMGGGEVAEVIIPAGYPGCLARTGPEPRAAVLAADFCDAERTSSGFSCIGAASGAIANVIVPTTATESHLSSVGASTVVFEGVETWQSVAGPPTLELASSLQAVTATHDGTGYAITGLGTGPVLGFPDDLVVTGTPPGGSEASVSVPAVDPADAYVAGVLRDPDGLRTSMRGREGAFDAMYVHATASGSTMAGEAGVMRLVPAASMTLDTSGTERTAPLFDDATIAELAARGLTLDTIVVGPVRFVENETLFPGRSVPVMTGRFVRIPASHLEAAPAAGECLPPTADLALSSTSRVSLCYDGTSMVCGMRHREGCSLAKWIGTFYDRTTGGFTFYTENDPPLPFRSTTHGTVESAGVLYNRVVDLPADTDITIQLDVTALSIGPEDVRFTFRRTGTVIEILDFQRVAP